MYVTFSLQVVGYDLASQPPYWLCKNSWSTNFAAGAATQCCQHCQ
jgi:hypothetical protein